MKYINVFENEAAYLTAKDSLATPQLAMEKENGKIFNLSAASTPTVEYVDLGLSVLWAKYNLGATHGDTPTSWYGNYYAWGETETKTNYSWSTYIHCNGSKTTLTKYNTQSKYGTVDNKTTLENIDDVAIQVQQLRMPTTTECEELITLPNEWINNYENVNGLNGRIFTGNGNTLFIPASGIYYESNIVMNSSFGFIYSNTLSHSESIAARYLTFNSTFIDILQELDRCLGLSVRGVCPKS